MTSPIEGRGRVAMGVLPFPELAVRGVMLNPEQNTLYAPADTNEERI